MNKYEVKITATDWCGYDCWYEVTAKDGIEAEDLATEMFEFEWDLIKMEDGWYEMCELDEQDKPLDEAEPTGITINYCEQIN